jgi:PAS domain S-box-containing protein
MEKSQKIHKNELTNSIIIEEVDSVNEIGLQEQLRESEIRYRRLFETAKDGILILDFETGEIVDANPFIVKLIDLPEDVVIGKKLSEIGLFCNREESERAFIELKENGYIRFDDMPIKQQNGTIKQVEFISNVYLANNTKVIQCNIRDITERKQAEKELKESFQLIQKMNENLIFVNAKAEESEKLKRAFLSNISHEIRTPLNAIIGFSQLLLEPNMSVADFERNIAIVKISSQQLLSIISDIIDISKIETGQFQLTSELVNVNNLMSELFELYIPKAEKKKIRLRLSGLQSDAHTLLNTDGERLKQVVKRLLNNAIKFTQNGDIDFGFHEKEHFVEFYIKDSGIGISSENHKLIFKHFRQVDAVNHEILGGNGLGLSIAKALVEKMGGTISVSSELSKGSTFTFTIPNTK